MSVASTCNTLPVLEVASSHVVNVINSKHLKLTDNRLCYLNDQISSFIDFMLFLYFLEVYFD